MTHSMLFVSVIWVQMRKIPYKIMGIYLLKWEFQYGRGWSPGLMQGIELTTSLHPYLGLLCE